MAIRTGVVAVMLALEAICRVLNSYDVKLRTAISQAITDGKISSSQGHDANAFLDIARDVCSIFQLIAGYKVV